MLEENYEKIQSLDHFFGPCVYYKVKIKRISNYRVKMCIFYFTWSFFRYCVF